MLEATACGGANGIYFSPTVGLLNHSCVPNAALSFDAAHRFELRALRPLGPGEEVVFSYLGPRARSECFILASQKKRLLATS